MSRDSGLVLGSEFDGTDLKVLQLNMWNALVANDIERIVELMLKIQQMGLAVSRDGAGIASSDESAGSYGHLFLTPDAAVGEFAIDNDQTPTVTDDRVSIALPGIAEQVIDGVRFKAIPDTLLNVAFQDADLRAIPYEWTASTEYQIAIGAAVRPGEARTNPKTGVIQYIDQIVEMGVAVEPAAVSYDAGLDELTLDVPVLSVELDEPPHTGNKSSLAGRRLLVWLKTPVVAGATAFVRGTLVWDPVGTKNYVVLTETLGQGVSPSTTASDYWIMIEGPIVAPLDVKEPFGIHDGWVCYLGKLTTGVTPGVDPTVVDMTPLPRLGSFRQQVLDVIDWYNENIAAGNDNKRMFISVRTDLGAAPVTNMIEVRKGGGVTFSVDQNGDVTANSFVNVNFEIDGDTGGYRFDAMRLIYKNLDGYEMVRRAGFGHLGQMIEGHRADRFHPGYPRVRVGWSATTLDGTAAGANTPDADNVSMVRIRTNMQITEPGGNPTYNADTDILQPMLEFHGQSLIEIDIPISPPEGNIVHIRKIEMVGYREKAGQTISVQLLGYHILTENSPQVPPKNAAGQLYGTWAPAASSPAAFSPPFTVAKATVYEDVSVNLDDYPLGDANYTYFLRLRYNGNGETARDRPYIIADHDADTISGAETETITVTWRDLWNDDDITVNVFLEDDIGGGDLLVATQIERLNQGMIDGGIPVTFALNGAKIEAKANAGFEGEGYRLRVTGSQADPPLFGTGFDVGTTHESWGPRGSRAGIRSLAITYAIEEL